MQTLNSEEMPLPGRDQRVSKAAFSFPLFPLHGAVLFKVYQILCHVIPRTTLRRAFLHIMKPSLWIMAQKR